MLFTTQELNSCSMVTGKNYWYQWIHGCDYAYDIAVKCWRF